MSLLSLELTQKQFKTVSKLVYDLSGIHLKEGKEALVRARLMKRLRALGMTSFNDYFKYIESTEGSGELGHMVDVITTNKTSFFREQDHFNFLRDRMLPNLNKSRARFWTAACSSGEEPYSLAILLRESIPDIDLKDIKILATDISTLMLEKARQGIYHENTLREVPSHLLAKYFTKLPNRSARLYEIKGNVRRMVRLAWLNLIDAWPMKGPFDVIFCRNVMIYFDRPTQQRLINRFWDILGAGGYLFVGHSEGLSAITHQFRYIRPAIYQK